MLGAASTSRFGKINFKLKNNILYGIQNECFGYLDAPIRVIGSEDLPAIPLNSTLEATMLPSAEKVQKAIEELLNY